MSRIVIILSVLIFLFSASVIAETETDVISQIKLLKMSKQQFLDMQRLGLDILSYDGEEVELLAKPRDITAIETLGIDYQIIYDNVKEYYVSHNKDNKSMGGFETFSEIEQHLDDLHLLYPDLTTEKYSAGTTLEGRNQWVMKISDNPDVDEDEPEVFYVAMIHSREPAAGASVLYFMEYLLSNYGTDPVVTDIVDNRELYFMPSQNPDGYVYNELTDPSGGGMWRKNRRDNGDGEFGIDLNRNYGEGWGYDDLGSSPYTYSELYRGTGPFSEPETENIKNFVASRNFTVIHNLHTYSNLEIWPICYDRFYSDREDFFVALGDSLTQYNGYDPGIGWTLYPTNGDADDWAWLDTVTKPRTISLTVEIGSAIDGFWPNPSRIPELVEENVFPNLFLAQIADNPYKLSPPVKPDNIISPDTVNDGTAYNVEWNLQDTINPPVSYRLIEYTGKQQVFDDAESFHGYWNDDRMQLTSARAHAGTYSWNSVNYDRSHHWLVSKTPYLVQENDSLRFWIWYAIEEGWDYFYAQVSTDGGLTYVNLPNNYTTNDDPNNQNLGNGITGFSNNWIQMKFDLTSYEGQQVYIRLAYYTDGYYLEEGVYLDDIGNIDVYTGANEITAVTDTFYTFSANPVGEYWYQVSGIDIDGQESQQSLFTKTVVNQSQTYLIGDLTGDQIIDISDLVFFVNYSFDGGPEPFPIEVADVDCSGSVDISDIVYMVNYMFNSGPPLGCD